MGWTGNQDTKTQVLINAGNFSVQFAISIDKLSALMFVVVNTVSFVVHAYSMGYMQKDKSKSRFFCYLSLKNAASHIIGHEKGFGLEHFYDNTLSPGSQTIRQRVSV